jgi:ubiquinone/menaquinone biosynthesis C-methylase UbiE
MTINPKNYEDRKKKWEQVSKNYKIDSTREATFSLTINNTLALLGDIKEGRLLDIGCGFGKIDILLAKNSNFNITGCDISDIALESAQNNIREADLDNRIKIEKADVYNLKYPDNFFDVILSFGYVSAATYRGVQKEVARVLKPGGLLICDFINCLSFYKFFPTLKNFLFKKKPYFFSLAGIKRRFEKEGLIFEKQVFFNTYPPLKFIRNPKIFLGFEDTLGTLFRTHLGRVRLVKFKKI